MKDGNTLVGATQQGKLLVVTPEGKVVKSITILNAKAGHSSMRNVRALDNGNFLVAEERAKVAREYSPDGELLREFQADYPVFSALRLPDGNTLTCGRTGITEFDASGKVTWQATNKDFPDLGIRWFAGIQVLDNGNIFVCNAGGKVHFAEINRDKKVVWRCDPDKFKGVAGHGIFLLNQKNILK